MKTCKKCDNFFENELNLANHEQRVHEYDETCEECVFRGRDLVAIKTHIVEVHRGESNASLSILSDMVESSLEESNPAVSILSDVSYIEEIYLEGLGIE